MRFISLAFLGLAFIAPLAHAQTATAPLTNTSETEKAKVLSVTGEEIATIPGTQTTHENQTLSAEVLSGSDTGKIVTVENDYTSLSVGQLFFLTHTVNADSDTDLYAVSDPDRLPELGILLGVFILLVLVVGGWTGLRGLLALGASFLFILYALLPGILAGYDPILVSIGVAGLIILFGSYLTHGINRTTTAAVVGMLATVAITALVAYWAVSATQLTGYSDENAVYLNFATSGQINFVGLLLGAMLIGFLGILYDAAIGQAVAVEELLAAKPDATRTHIFKRAMRIGREHIGALVNTLAIAYVGVSLPLLLLFQQYADEPFLITINREIFATEIVRAAVGSIGIVLAVPVTTLIAIFLLTRTSPMSATMERHGHHHS